MSDAVIIFGITTFFVALGLLLPMIRADFGDSSPSSVNVSGIQTDLVGVTDLTAWGAIKSVGSMFLWSFGAIWWPVDLLIMLPLRLVLIFVVVRNMVGGGA